ncbi:MAG: hypothetical protein R3F48_02005 [Candidatus Zixiibacteriota bacterium]
MIRFILMLCITALLLTSTLIADTTEPAQTAAVEPIDTTKVYHIQTVVEVTGKRITPTQRDFPVAKGQFNTILNTNGFSLIRKGTFFAQDIYADGLKRGDIQVVVDGERYHSACPNRMDSPLTRANPLEMAGIEMVKNTGTLQSGIGGAINYQREKPMQPLKIRAGLSQAAGVTENSDAAFAINSHDHRINARYATGRGYEDADGESFVDRYGYKQNYSYRLAEGSVIGRRGDWQYRTGFTYTDDVMFPYLQMDERVNRVWSGFVSYKGHKLYANHTSHVMDNGLRVSTGTMVTDATNFTVGATGSFYEVFYRNWDADNEIATPMMRIENHLMPDVSVASGALQKQIDKPHWGVSGKAGIVYHKMGDANRLDFFKALYPDAEDSRLLPTFGLNAYFKTMLSKNVLGVISAEVASDVPATENMYITVQKPMGKPYWLGNPTMDAPVKAGLRAKASYKGASFEAFATRIWNYVNFTRASAGMVSYMTYENIDAVLTGFNFTGEWKYVDLNAFYTWANNTSSDSAMSEIPPLTVTTTLKSPEYKGFKAQFQHTFADAQTRIDESLDERTTPSWHRFDLGLSYKTGSLRFALDVENLTDELYYQHMSYLRNPYASGDILYEPGRTFRFTVTFDEVFSKQSYHRMK